MMFVPQTPYLAARLGPQLWLEGDRSAATFNVGNFSQLDDLSPNGGNAVQATASRQPGESTLNGLRCWTGDRVNDFFTVPDNAVLNPGSGDFTIISVIESDDPGNAQILAMKGRTGAGGSAFRRYNQLMSGATLDRAEIEVDDDTTPKSVRGNTAIANNVRVILSGRDGDDLRLFVDGVEASASPLAMGAYGTVDSSPAQDLHIMVTAVALTNPFRGKYASYVFLKRWLSVDEIGFISNAQLSKWG